MADLLEALLEELRQSADMPNHVRLCYLSTLEADEAACVREAWPHVPVALRRELVVRLMRMAEADFTLDFGKIFRVAMNDEDAEVRTTAIEGLWEDQDVRLIPLLVERLLADETVSVRAAAAKSLGRFILLGELEKIRSEPREVAYDALLSSCQASGEHYEVRRRAMESLAYTGGEVVAGLIQDAYAASEERVRISAVFAMGRSADTRWEQQVQQELFSPNPEMRYEAARACGELQLTEAVSDLEELADDADIEVQETALWALGQIGGDEARAILERYCTVDHEALRSAAQAALEELEFLHGDLSGLFVSLSEETTW